MKTILVTGAKGFVGRSLVSVLEMEGYSVKCAVRGESADYNPLRDFVVGNIGKNTEWATALIGVDTVVHLAARVHVMYEQAADPLLEFRAVNVNGTEKLARQAADAGVSRLIYVSSIKVNGEYTGTEATDKFKESDSNIPNDPYAISKYEAEQLLRKIEKQTNLDVTIIRPPLVYGPGVKANFYRLLTWVEKGIPLPLLNVTNKRSMVSVFNLVELIKTCIDHPRAAGEAFLVSDGNDLSTAELIQHIAKAMNKPSRLFSMPVWALNGLAKATGKTEEMRRLCGSLQVDISKAENILGWVPPVSVDEGIQRTVDWFLEKNNKS